jgi:hypothetical protein
MKKSTVFILIICLFAFAACKKHSSAPAIVNAWVFTNVSGTSSYNLSSSTGALITYSCAGNIITESTWYPAFSSQSVSTYQLISEVWTLNGDGTFTINEIYITSPGSGNGPDTANSSGTWAYGSKADNTIILSGGSSYILTNITDTNEYTIQTANNSTLALTAAYTSVNIIGDTQKTNVTLTFTKE